MKAKVAKIVEQYVAAVIGWEQAINNADHRLANKLARAQCRAYLELQAAGKVRDGLLSLLDHENSSVQCSAAVDLLREGEIATLSKLKELAAGTGLAALDAETVLEEWSAGRPPPPIEPEGSNLPEAGQGEAFDDARIPANVLPATHAGRLVAKYYYHENGDFVQLENLDGLEFEGGALDIGGRITIEVDENRTLWSVCVETPDDEWLPMDDFPPFPEKAVPADLSFDEKVLDHYYFDPDCGVQVYVNGRRDSFLIRFSDNEAQTVVELGDKCYAFLNDDCLTGFMFAIGERQLAGQRLS